MKDPSKEGSLLRALGIHESLPVASPFQGEAVSPGIFPTFTTQYICLPHIYYIILLRNYQAYNI